MNRIPRRGLAVALVVAALSVLGVGTSAADDGKRDPVTQIVCQVQRNC